MLLDEVSSLDHTPVELLTESKFLVGSAVCLPPMILALLHGEGGVLFAPHASIRFPGFGRANRWYIQLGTGDGLPTFRSNMVLLKVPPSLRAPLIGRD